MAAGAESAPVTPAASSASGGEQPLDKGNNPSDNGVQRTRAWTGLWVVIGGDVAIAAAAAFAVWKAASAGGNIAPLVAILTSAFTAISTMTTAYFGIKTMSNTAQSFAAAQTAVAKAQTGRNPTANSGAAG
jgi:hypothetical protein